MCRTADFWAVRTAKDGAQSDLRAYLIVERPRGGNGNEQQRAARVVEFAGDRHALLAALPRLFAVYEPLAEVRWQVQRHDILFRSLCESAGLVGTPSVGPGTIKLLHFRASCVVLARAGKSCWAKRTPPGSRSGNAADSMASALPTTNLSPTATRPRASCSARRREAKRRRRAQPRWHGLRRGVARRAGHPFPAAVPWYGINYV
jgi:hypothetical protein